MANIPKVYDMSFVVGGGGSGGGSIGGLDAYSYSSASVKINANDIVLKRSGKPDLSMGEAIDQILDRLAILQPDFEKMERYPALKEAYESYKLLENLIGKVNE